MLGKFTGIAIGYLAAWSVNTPEGRRTAAKIGRAVLRQFGAIERQIIGTIKSGVKKDERDDGERPQDETSNSV